MASPMTGGLLKSITSSDQVLLADSEVVRPKVRVFHFASLPQRDHGGAAPPSAAMLSSGSVSPAPPPQNQNQGAHQAGNQGGGHHVAAADPGAGTGTAAPTILPRPGSRGRMSREGSFVGLSRFAKQSHSELNLTAFADQAPRESAASSGILFEPDPEPLPGAPVPEPSPRGAVVAEALAAELEECLTESAQKISKARSRRGSTPGPYPHPTHSLSPTLHPSSIDGWGHQHFLGSSAHGSDGQVGQGDADEVERAAEAAGRLLRDFEAALAVLAADAEAGAEANHAAARGMKADAMSAVTAAVELIGQAEALGRALAGLAPLAAEARRLRALSDHLEAAVDRALKQGRGGGIAAVFGRYHTGNHGGGGRMDEGATHTPIPGASGAWGRSALFGDPWGTAAHETHAHTHAAPSAGGNYSAHAPGGPESSVRGGGLMAGLGVDPFRGGGGGGGGAGGAAAREERQDSRRSGSGSAGLDSSPPYDRHVHGGLGTDTEREGQGGGMGGGYGGAAAAARGGAALGGPSPPGMGGPRGAAGGYSAARPPLGAGGNKGGGGNKGMQPSWLEGWWT